MPLVQKLLLSSAATGSSYFALRTIEGAEPAFDFLTTSPVQSVILFATFLGAFTVAEQDLRARRLARDARNINASTLPKVQADDVDLLENSIGTLELVPSTKDAVASAVRGLARGDNGDAVGAAILAELRQPIVASDKLVAFLFSMLPVVGLFGTVLEITGGLTHLNSAMSLAQDFERLNADLSNFSKDIAAGISTTVSGIAGALLLGVLRLFLGRGGGGDQAALEQAISRFTDAVVHPSAIETLQLEANKKSIASMLQLHKTQLRQANTAAMKALENTLESLLERRLHDDNELLSEVRKLNETAVTQMKAAVSKPLKVEFLSHKRSVA